MKFEYDPEVDALYIYVNAKGPVARTIAGVLPGVNLDVSKDNTLKGVEILNASNTVPFATLSQHVMESIKKKEANMT